MNQLEKILINYPQFKLISIIEGNNLNYILLKHLTTKQLHKVHIKPHNSLADIILDNWIKNHISSQRNEKILKLLQ